MRYTPAQLQTLTAQALVCAQNLSAQINTACAQRNYPVAEGNALTDAFYTLHTAVSEVPAGTDLLSAVQAGADALWESATSPATILLAQTWGKVAAALPGPRIRAIELLDAFEQASGQLRNTYLLPADPYDPIHTMFAEIHGRIADLAGEADMDQMLLRTASEVFSAAMISGRIELLGLALLALTNPHLSQDTPQQTLELVIGQLAEQAPVPAPQAGINVLWRKLVLPAQARATSAHPETATPETAAPETEPALRIAKQIAPGHAFCAQRLTEGNDSEWVLGGNQLRLAAAENGRASSFVSYQAATTSAPERAARGERVVTLSAASALETPRLLVIDTKPGIAWEIARLGAGVAVTNDAARLWRILRAYQPQLVIAPTPEAAQLVARAQALTLVGIAKSLVRTPTLFDFAAWGESEPAAAATSTGAHAVAPTKNAGSGLGKDTQNDAVTVLNVDNYVELLLLVSALMEPLPQLLADADKARLLEGRAAYAHANFSSDPAQLRAADTTRASDAIALLGRDMELPGNWQELPNLQVMRVAGLAAPQLGGLLR